MIQVLRNVVTATMIERSQRNLDEEVEVAVPIVKEASIEMIDDAMIKEIEVVIDIGTKIVAAAGSLFLNPYLHKFIYIF